MSDEHFVIYEVIDNSVSIQGTYINTILIRKNAHFINIGYKKMIQVPTGYYKQVVFDELDDDKYKDLFKKEYAFCL